MIWGADGSPLLAHSQKQKTLLMGYLGQRLKDLGLPSDLAPVELAMRYGNPGVADAFGRLKAAGCDRILVVPLFPQYSASATAAALDAVFAHAQRMRRMPACGRSTASTTTRATSGPSRATSATTGCATAARTCW